VPEDGNGNGNGNGNGKCELSIMSRSFWCAEHASS